MSVSVNDIRPTNCPKCGAERWPHNGLLSCRSGTTDGVFVQSYTCRINELQAEIARLREEIDNLRKENNDLHLSPTE